MAGQGGENYKNKKPRYSKKALKRRRKRMIGNAIFLGGLLLAIVAGILILTKIFIKGDQTSNQLDANQSANENAVSDKSSLNGSLKTKSLTVKKVLESPKFDVELLTINKYSRPGTMNEGIKGIVIHYVGNPGTTAEQNRNFFESLSETGTDYLSSHFVVGIDGEIIQCIPTAEIAYASNGRNIDTISIEVCHPDADGKFTDETYDALVEFVAWLCGKFDLSVDDVIRHYDVTGKECPLYYVKHEDAWEQLKEDIADYIDKNGTVVTVDANADTGMDTKANAQTTD